MEWKFQNNNNNNKTSSKICLKMKLKVENNKTYAYFGKNGREKKSEFFSLKKHMKLLNTNTQPSHTTHSTHKHSISLVL